MSPTVVEILLAGLNVDRGLRDAITGDLIEEHAGLAAIHGERCADRWMRRQIIRSLPAFLKSAILDGGLPRLAAIVGAAVAALLAVSLLIGASVALLSLLVSPEMIARMTIVAFVIDLAYGAAGGYLAARLGRAAPLGAAFVFGVLGLSITLISSEGGDMQSWYRPALVLLLIPATVSGGWLRARHLARRPHSA